MAIKPKISRHDIQISHDGTLASGLPAPEAEPDQSETAVDLAIKLLSRIAEDPALRPSYRQQARQYFRELRRATAQVKSAVL